MLIFGQTHSAEFEIANFRSRALVAELLRGVETIKQDAVIPAETIIDSRTHRLMLIREGSLAVFRNDKKLFVYEEGDLVGIEQLLDFGPPLTLKADFAVIVDDFDYIKFLTHLGQHQTRLDAWTKYLALRVQMIAELLAESVSEHQSYAPDISFYQAESEILREGNISNSVYCLIEGSAEVRQNGKRVSVLETDELFGVLSAFTGGPSDITVVAVTDCSVAAIPASQVEKLIVARPKLAKQIIEKIAVLPTRKKNSRR